MLNSQIVVPPLRRRSFPVGEPLWLHQRDTSSWCRSSISVCRWLPDAPSTQHFDCRLSNGRVVIGCLHLVCLARWSWISGIDLWRVMQQVHGKSGEFVNFQWQGEVDARQKKLLKMGCMLESWLNFHTKYLQNLMLTTTHKCFESYWRSNFKRISEYCSTRIFFR